MLQLDWDQNHGKHLKLQWSILVPITSNEQLDELVSPFPTIEELLGHIRRDLGLARPLADLTKTSDHLCGSIF